MICRRFSKVAILGVLVAASLCSTLLVSLGPDKMDKTFAIQHAAGVDLLRRIEALGYVSEDCGDLSAGERLAIFLTKAQLGDCTNRVLRYRTQRKDGGYLVEAFWVCRVSGGFLVPSTDTYFSFFVSGKLVPKDSVSTGGKGGD